MKNRIESAVTFYLIEKREFMVSYLQVEGLVKSFGDRVLFENFSLGIGEGQRVGLIAKNGTGKTTLLNILAGEEDYDSGTITFRRDLKVAYLEQDPKFPAERPLLEACFLSDSPVIRAIADYERAVQRSGLQNDDDHTLQEAIAQMDRLDAWTYESRVKQILTRLNITAFDQPTGQSLRRPGQAGRAGQCADRRNPTC